MSEKEVLRNAYKEILRSISKERRYRAKEALFSFLKTELERYNNILSFASFKDEIDLSEINQFLVSQKKLHLSPQPEFQYDCILVPGLSFDKRGFRLGRGMGYYDKLLVKYPDACTIGLMFIEQIHDVDLPIEPHDVPVQKLCPF